MTNPLEIRMINFMVAPFVLLSFTTQNTNALADEMQSSSAVVRLSDINR